jgi:2-oxoglutarate dehydrogenase E2 component (dihydrolipoamide succinyltransferase)
MADFELIMPKMGESVQEATVTKWMVKPGDMVVEDDALVEIATDKVDTEIPSPVAGKVLRLLFSEGALVPVGEVIAVINTEGKGEVSESAPAAARAEKETKEGPSSRKISDAEQKQADEGKKEDVQKVEDLEAKPTEKAPSPKGTDRFYSPLVRSIAEKENISRKELATIQGTGINGRVRKQDILAYIGRKETDQVPPAQAANVQKEGVRAVPKQGDQVVEMDRMRRIIADHMVMSKRTSPHVTNFIEADVTHLALWREKVKDDFYKKEQQKITFLPVIIEAVAKALKEYPGINASVGDNTIILRKNVNIGIAVALPSGNLIVPVIKNADEKSLLGLTVELNRLAEAARSNELTPDDIQDGTFTISNFGTFRNLTGTPVINQPQAAILATGAIEKKPAVIETPAGDVIAIRHKMILSLSYDHRIIDGALGGAYLRRLADLLEAFDMNRTI